MTDACAVCPTRLVQNASQMLGVSLGDIVPPEAQRHLLNAQRELLLAVMVTIDHNTSRGARTATTTTARRRSAKRKSPSRHRPSRVELE